MIHSGGSAICRKKKELIIDLHNTVCIYLKYKSRRYYMRKKAFAAAALVILLALSACTGNNSLSGTEREKTPKEFIYDYSEELEGNIIRRYLGEDDNVIVPEEIGGSPVKSIALTDNDRIKDVSLPEGIVRLEPNAFSGCTSLEYIYLPGSLEELGSMNCFFGCLFDAIVIPEGIEKVPYQCFADCKKLKDVSLPSTLTEIEELAFYNCQTLERIDIPESVTKIGTRAFSYCKELRAPELPPSLKTLGYEAFYNCPSLTSIEIPDGTEVIEQWAFKYCDNLEDVWLPDSIKTIGKEAFNFCVKIKVHYKGETYTKSELNKLYALFAA